MKLDGLFPLWHVSQTKSLQNRVAAVMPHAFYTERKRAQIVPVWDYRKLILALGTSDQLAERIRNAGYDPPHPKTINGWRYRGRVPSQWTPLLIKWGLKAGAIKSVDQLLVKDKVTL
jgi:hypothetical protein